MITIEIMLVITITFVSLMAYVIYKLIKNEIDEYICEVRATQSASLDCFKTYGNKIDHIEQKLKDGLQSNSICCRSAIDRINSRISLIEKNQTGSIKVVKKESSKKEMK
jgi:hypothetical protein